MLVVIAIIAILAALITPAVAGALWSARQTKIKVELDQLASGMEAFKAKYGSYPPTNLTCSSGVANANLQSFVARAFPRYSLRWAGSLGAQIAGDLTNQGVDTTNYNPQAALVFWLAGQSPDVTDPFGAGTTSNGTLPVITRSSFFQFDTTRLVYSNTIKGTSIGTVAVLSTSPMAPVGNLMYNAPYGNAAYAYFDYTSYGTVPTNGLGTAGNYSSTVSNTVGPIYAPCTSGSSVTGISLTTALSNGTGLVSPYFGDANNNGIIDNGELFCKPQSFQIISAGQDGLFGPATSPTGTYFSLYPIGVGYDSAGADNDNITNFCEKNNLDAAKP